MARGRGRGTGRGRGRPPKQKRLDADTTGEDISMDDDNINESNVSLNESNLDESISKVEVVGEPVTPRSDGPRKRGRKRKSEIVQMADRSPVVEPIRQEIRASTGLGGSLRRRDTLKQRSRYSPPPPVVSSRGRGSAHKFPSTTNSSRYLMTDDDDEVTPKIEPTFTNKRKSLGVRSSPAVVSEVENIEVTKSEDNTKFVVTLPDGSNVKLDAPLSKENEMEPEAEDVEEPKKEEKDPEYKPPPAAIRVVRKKSETQVSTPTSEVEKTPKLSQQITTVKLTNTVSTPISAVTKASNVNQATPVTVASKSQFNSLSKIPAILKPSMASTPVTAAITKSTLRRPLPLSKYLDTLPEVNECIHNDGVDDSEMKKMPDKILLVHSELPLPLAVSVDKEDDEYLFRQIISPVNAVRFVCLLCKGIEVNFGTKEEKDILLHYQSLHELDVEIGHAKFSEDIVFICLPKIILNQFNTSSTLALNSPCQYCDSRLSDIREMKEHYSNEHKKEVIMMEQEEIMRMHHFFYCCKCKFQSPDFDSHHKHMKSEHGLKTFRCKSCVLVTQDENRLRTHFKAKHMLHTHGQNLQCYYCHGLLIGMERLQKHIQQSHMVQTSQADFSCISCLKPSGRGKELLTHARTCSLAGMKPVKNENKFIPVPDDQSPLNPGEIVCYFCNVRLESEQVYANHLHHEHMKWVSENKAEVKDDQAETSTFKEMTLEETISDEDLAKAKIQTYVGHWCRICDQMIKVYQLYYLHMNNFHKLQKEFQCCITDCKAQFAEFESFKQHIEETGHIQKTIISHSDEVFVCAYCDLYFESEERLINHLITDQHINKFTSSGHFHRTEPRNYKCKACHTFFGMKESYIHHLETESHQYICNYCGITTATPSSRRAHIQNTHPDKLQNCEDCGEYLTDSLAHFVSHGYTFECKKCIKKFYNREKLNAHMEVHQDPIECTWEGCGRMIATRSMMVTHYRSHKSEHKCQICGQAFWNFSMLTSHLRSHTSLRSPQPPRVGQSPVSRPQMATYANRTNLQKQKINPPILSNSVIKCGHCHNLFKSTKELNVHKCANKFTPNGNQKLLDLASKATALSKPANRPTPPRRRASPKKAVQQQQPVVEQQMLDITSLTDQNIEHTQEEGDEDTQLIMILNQTTGELMEITAPKGMEVQDVINSLNFSQSMEEVITTQVDDLDESSQQIITKIEEPEQEETAAAIEMIEQQVNEETSVNPEEQQQSIPTETATELPSEEIDNKGEEAMLVEHSEEVPIAQEEQHPITQIIETEGGQQHEIILPPNCFNEDGSLTLDADTLSRLNLAIADDGNMAVASDNASYIIETSSIKE